MNKNTLLGIMAALGAFALPLVSLAAEDEAANTAAVASPEAATRLLATFTLSPFARNYQIPIRSCAQFGDRLTHIKLRVTGNIAYIDRLSVAFANRQVQNLNVRRKFNPNTESRWIDLGVSGRNDSRCVASLMMRAQAQPDWRRFRLGARVQVYGMTERMGRR